MTKEQRCKNCVYIKKLGSTPFCLYHFVNMKSTPKRCEFKEGKKERKPKMEIALIVCLILIFAVGCIMYIAAGK